ncbi:unnamed protein product [Polarella glacialis]|uniref:Helicase C-terminal domain-containing protein n=1 Tax=Polarella glacialis TaxID=89957 RepID=A0A813HL41_POLGL|nr:unnamed protein product [Polarella glacialis]
MDAPAQFGRQPERALRATSLRDKRAEVLQCVQQHDICFVEAATGMGKSTLIPQFVLEADPSSVVWQLQPRRLATKRLAEYMGKCQSEVEVGYCVRGDQQASKACRLIYMTTGYFLHFVLHHLQDIQAGNTNSARPEMSSSSSSAASPQLPVSSHRRSRPPGQQQSEQQQQEQQSERQQQSGRQQQEQQQSDRQQQQQEQQEEQQQQEQQQQTAQTNEQQPSQRREVQSSCPLQRRWCTHLFVDEVHEASEEIELVLLLVKLLGQQLGRLPFRVVVLSATLDFQTLHDYFLQPVPSLSASRQQRQQQPPVVSPQSVASVLLHTSPGASTALLDHTPATGTAGTSATSATTAAAATTTSTTPTSTSASAATSAATRTATTERPSSPRAPDREPVQVNSVLATESILTPEAHMATAAAEVMEVSTTTAATEVTLAVTSPSAVQATQVLAIPPATHARTAAAGTTEMLIVPPASDCIMQLHRFNIPCPLPDPDHPDKPPPPLGLRLERYVGADQQHWKVASVAPATQGLAFGLLEVNDRLLEVNNSSMSSVSQQTLDLTMRSRPLSLLIARPSSVSVASKPLQLALETPYEVEVLYLDDLQQHSADLGQDLSNLHFNFNSEKHNAGFGPDPLLLGLAVRLLLHACRSPEHSALVFLPGISEIDFFVKELERAMKDSARQGLNIVVLHSVTLSETIDVPAGPSSSWPTAYIATSIAETSITLPELSVVFDFGLSRFSIFDSYLQMEQLVTRGASQSSGKQRAGRVGRTRPGRAYRLYPRAHWDSMPATDSWGGKGLQRCLESTALLLTKTLVPFLGLELQTCMSLLVRPATEKEIADTLAQLEELDALVPGSDSQPQLTAFGEFAACLALLGPRLSRLVYCGLVFGCARLAIAVAAVHAVKSELFSMPRDLQRSALQEKEPPKPMEKLCLRLDSDHKLGLVFEPWEIEASSWLVLRVNEGSWAFEHDLRAEDELISINSMALQGMSENEILGLLRSRPLELVFERLASAKFDAAPALGSCLDFGVRGRRAYHGRALRTDWGRIGVTPTGSPAVGGEESAVKAASEKAVVGGKA